MSITKVEDVAFVRFSAPDLPRMRAFLEDFGLECFEDGAVLYGRGRDGAPFLHATEEGPPAFRGFALRVPGPEALAALADAEGVAVAPLDAPGGGDVVRLTDPDGHVVEVVAGQATAAPPPHAAAPAMNAVAARPRVDQTIRVAPGPSRVHRLGHVVLNVRDFRTSEAWYKERFGFVTSDEIEAAPGLAMGAFLRCDRGDQPTDHHTLFLAQLPGKPGFNHAAFEVHGIDDLMAGHAHLKAAKRTAAWGVGRHILGSQVFDYWKDPWGHELEHWTDGDRFTAASAPNTATLRDLLAVQWGAPFPALSGPRAPSVETASRLMALGLRIRRFFQGRSKGKTA